MKRTIIIALLIVALVFSVEAANDFVAYAGAGYASFDVSGFEDICFSDWQKYGLKSVNPSSAEGRVLLQMGSVNGKSNVFGVVLGAEGDLSDYLKVLAEVGVYPGKNNSLLIEAFGAAFVTIPAGVMSFGAGVKVGYSALCVTLGTLEMIPGYIAPVVTNGTTYRVGEQMNFYHQSVSCIPTVEIAVHFTDSIRLSAQAGYHVSVYNIKNYLSVGTDRNSKKVDLSSRSIVKNDGSSTQAGMNPSVKYGKLRAQVTLSYLF